MLLVTTAVRRNKTFGFTEIPHFRHIDKHHERPHNQQLDNLVGCWKRERERERERLTPLLTFKSP